jgi:hypothetical protein
MTTPWVIWLLLCAALYGAGALSMQQARYFDGDPNAHWFPDHNLPLLHTPRHPHAIKAKQRGWIFLGLAGVVTAAGLTAHWLTAHWLT